MNTVDCSAKKNEYSGRVRLLKGDEVRVLKAVEFLNEGVQKRDGFIKQGHNRCNGSHAISAALDCFFEKHKLQSA